jgi:UDP-4-amino-4,6-dideoxy-N-acetyl-beta-L-altrosamine transaminase
VIPYGRQHVTDADIAAVADVLRSDFLTQGPAVPRFERAVAARCNADHAIAVNSATSALHLACLVLGLGPGDWLWTSPITFVASANCARYCGAQVDFVDIDPQTYTMCPEALRRKLELAQARGRLPKIVVPVDHCGHPADLAAIRALADEFGFRVVEDASHSIGGRYRGEAIGSGRYSDITIFSFHPVKIITTGEGGMLLTASAELAERAALLRTHGITRDPGRMTHAPDGDWYYQQIELGFNYRMTDIQAALGLSQLDRLDAYLASRHALASRYDRLLAGLPLGLPFRRADCYSGFHLYVVRVLRESGRNRREVFDSLRAQGIGANVHYIPVHTQPYYRAMGFADGDFPVAEAYYAEALSLPLYPTLTEADQDVVVAAMTRALRG